MNFEQFRNYVWGMYGNNTISRAWEIYKQSQHALWMTRAERAKTKANFYDYIAADNIKMTPIFKRYNFLYEKWKMVERKCLQKAKEFE